MEPTNSVVSSGAAESQLSRTAVGQIDLPTLVSNYRAETDDVYVSSIFQALLSRSPTQEERDHFASWVAAPGGRTRAARNLVASAGRAQDSGSDDWMALIDAEVEASRALRLRAAMRMPAAEFVRELYSTVLRRSPDPAGFAQLVSRAENHRDRADLIGDFARSGEAQVIGVDPAALLSGLGWQRFRSRVVRTTRRQAGRALRKMRRLAGVAR